MRALCDILRRAAAGLALIGTVMLPPPALAALPAGMDPPTVDLAGVRVLEMTATQQTLGLRLRVHNPNMFDIPLHSLRYELLLNGDRLVRADREQPITLPGGKDEVVEVRAVVSMRQVIDQVQAMVARGESGADYRLRGELRLGNGHATIPYDQKGRIDLRDFLPLEPSAPASNQPTYI